MIPSLFACGAFHSISVSKAGCTVTDFPPAFQVHGIDVHVGFTYPCFQQKSTFKSKAAMWLQLWPSLKIMYPVAHQEIGKEECNINI